MGSVHDPITVKSEVRDFVIDNFLYGQADRVSDSAELGKPLLEFSHLLTENKIAPGQDALDCW